MTTWQATRALTTADGRPVDVSIGIPEMDDSTGMWRCAIRFVVDGVESTKPIDGADAFDALQVALAHICQKADDLGCKQRDDLPAKSHGFYRPILVDPLFYDVDKFNEDLEARLARFDADPEPARRLGRKVMARAEEIYETTGRNPITGKVKDGGGAA